MYVRSLQTTKASLIFPLICRCLCHKEQILSLVIACLLATTPVAVCSEPGPLMKLGVSSSVRLIGQVCPGLRLPVIEVSSEGPLCSRHCTLLRSTPTAKKLAAPLSASP
ncbi:hypothetical protein NQZ68_025852 [Dissostichus eleginoides]|nr:hypothetical protein NQZ68_025852 [Dissostichus eleginoides]